MNKLIILLMALLILALSSGIGTAAEIFVSPEGPIQSIQTAVNSASSGDVIIVKPGTYNEYIKVITPNLIIKSESGNPENTIITTTNTNGFNVTANTTTISGFRIKAGETSILLYKCRGCSITNNDLSSNKYGIFLNSSNYSTISGNKANFNSLYGIHILTCEGNNISYNNIDSNVRGINSITSKNNKIIANSASNNSVYGMWISQSNDNTISENTVNESGNDGSNGRISGGGIHFNSSSRNTITGNIVASNIGSGIFECPGCHNNIVYNNYINNVYNANINTRDTTWNREKTLDTNIVGGPFLGGNFWGTPSGTGFSETAVDTDGDGLSDTVYNASNITDKLPLVSGKSNLPVANFDANTSSGNAPLPVQFTDLSQNALSWTWDFGDGASSIEQNPVHVYTNPGTYTVSLSAANANGTRSKTSIITVGQASAVLPVANFSSNVTGGTVPLAVQFTDLSQNASSWNWDFNSDGISDSIEQNPVTVYTNPGDYTVNLTVSNTNGTASKTQQINVQDDAYLPVAVPSANVTSGYIPLCVQFTDLSQNITSRSWDIGNDGTVDSTDASFIYEFSSRGTYPVKLTVNNENGSSSEIITISALRKSSSSGGSSSGSGGAGGSPEPAKNVKSKELCQVFITSGKAVKFDFAKNATSIVALNFDSKKTVGKTTTIVEMLKNKSTLTKETPEDEVYNYLNIWVGNGGYGSDEDNLENAVINFKVEKAWVQDKGIDKSSITINRYNDNKWNALPTTFLSEDDKYLYFKAETLGFSPFAIMGDSTEKQINVEIQPETEDKEENAGNTTSDLKPQSETKENTNTPGKDTSTSGFEMIYGVVCLLGIFLYRRQKI